MPEEARAEKKMMENNACENTDVELWRAVPGDYYSPSLHITKEGSLGINVGGMVIVKTLAEWHKCARASTQLTQAQAGNSQSTPCEANEGMTSWERD